LQGQLLGQIEKSVSGVTQCMSVKLCWRYLANSLLHSFSYTFRLPYN